MRHEELTERRRQALKAGHTPRNTYETYYQARHFLRAETRPRDSYRPTRSRSRSPALQASWQSSLRRVARHNPPASSRARDGYSWLQRSRASSRDTDGQSDDYGRLTPAYRSYLQEDTIKPAQPASAALHVLATTDQAQRHSTKGRASNDVATTSTEHTAHGAISEAKVLAIALDVATTQNSDIRQDNRALKARVEALEAKVLRLEAICASQSMPTPAKM